MAYVDIESVGTALGASDPAGPSGPLGGLGPLPALHQRTSAEVDLGKFQMGLKPKDALDLLELMSKNQVVILEAGTGTGKSTLAPFRLMNPPDGAAYRPTDIGPIVVTEPRILATTEVATFVGELMCFGHDPDKCTAHVGPGYPVGYQCDGKKVWDESCQLIYVTDGTMLNWIANGELRRFSTIVIDEAHERSEIIDGILTLLHSNLHRYPDLKVVVASATIDPKFFIDFFVDGAHGVGHLSIEATKTIGYGVPLFPDIGLGEEELESGCTIADVTYSGWSDQPSVDSDHRDLRQETRRLLKLRAPVQRSLDNWVNNAAKAAADQAFCIIRAVCRGEAPPGDIIAFLPGRRQCLKAKEQLQRRIDEAGLPVAAYWLMKDTDEDEKKLATSDCPPGRYKVVFASNLAETSLTIPGLRYVVDSGLINQQEWQAHIATETILPKMHSRSGVRQRWGRVGRKTYGWVFPLYTVRQFEDMPKDTPAGSTTVNLEPTLLKLASAGVTDLRRLKFPANFATAARDAAGDSAANNFSTELARARESLAAVGALTGAGDVTSFGAELAKSRLPPERTTALLFADRLACVPETALALVALDGGSLAGSGRLLRHEHSWPAAWAVHARKCHEALAVGCEDDLDLILRIFAEWESAKNPEQWADQWWVDADALEEIRAESRKLIDSFAPGMSAEAARRPIDLRLASRVRAVLSRTLTSLRFTRASGGLWRAVGSGGDSSPVVLAPERLVEPSRQIVALRRDVPRPSWGKPLSATPVLYGTVNVLEWACSDRLEPFDLMLAARERLRHPNGDLIHAEDPLRGVRNTYPVGSVLRVRLRAERDGGTTLAEHRVMSRGFTFEYVKALATAVPRSEGEINPSRRRVYQGVPRSEAETAGEVGRRPANVAGAELAPEELSGQPRNIKDLELDEEVAVIVPRMDPASTASLGTDPEGAATYVYAAAVSADQCLSAGQELIVRVAGHALRRGDSPSLLLEVVSPAVAERADPAWHDDLDAGDEVVVVAGGLERSHFTTFRVLHRCDDDGVPDGNGSFIYEGPMLDEWDTAGSESIHAESRWRAVIGAADGSAGPRQTVSILDGLSQAFIEATGLRPILGRPAHGRPEAAVEISGEVVGVRASNREWSEFFIVRLHVPELQGFDARVFVPMSEASSLPSRTVSEGERVTLRVGPKLAARRSGEWAAADVDRLVAGWPGYFKPAKRPINVDLATAAPLTRDGLAALLSVDPGNASYTFNASRLWESSRRIGVMPKSGLMIVGPPAGPAARAEPSPPTRPSAGSPPVNDVTVNRSAHQQSGRGRANDDLTGTLDARRQQGVSGAPPPPGRAAPGRPRPTLHPPTCPLPRGGIRPPPWRGQPQQAEPKPRVPPLTPEPPKQQELPEAASESGRNDTPPPTTRSSAGFIALLIVIVLVVAGAVYAVPRVVGFFQSKPSGRTISSIDIGGSPEKLLINESGSQLYVVGRGGGGAASAVTLLDPATWTVVNAPIELGDSAMELDAALSPDGRRMYFTLMFNGGQRDEIGYLDIESREVRSYRTRIGDPTSIAVAPDGGRVYVTDPTGTLTVFSPELDRLAQVSLGHTYPGGMIASRDGSRVLVLAQSGVCSVALDGGAPRCSGPVSPNAQPVDVVESADGAAIFVATDSSLFVIDSASMQVVESHDGYRGIGDMARTGDRSRLVIRGDVYVAILDAATRSLIEMVNINEAIEYGEAGAIVVGADGTTIYTIDIADESLLNVSQ